MRSPSGARHDETVSEPSRSVTDLAAGDAADPRLDRVLREAAAPGVLSALVERLSPTDLQTLLLAAYRRRAAAVTPGRLLEQYRRNRFARPSPLAPADLARLELVVHERLAEHGFTSVALSPVCPLGAHSAVATVDQNKVLTTIRNTEVVADATNALALECAVRRRELMRENPRSRQRVRLAATHRVLRAQRFTGPDLAAHFQLLGMCTAGRDEGSFRFQTAALTEQIRFHLDVLDRVRGLGHLVPKVRVTVTDLTGGRHRTAVGRDVLDPLARTHPGIAFAFDDARTAGRGYYTGACFEIRATAVDGEDLNLADGGFTSWTAALTSNAKERLLVSGLGVERLCRRFRPAAAPCAVSRRTAQDGRT